MKDGQVAKTFITFLPGYEVNLNCLIGDPASPLTPFYMKEYQTYATNWIVARNIVECTFGRLSSMEILNDQK